MIAKGARVRRAANTTRGMTLIEVVLAMVVLGMLLGSVAQGVSLSIRMQRSTAERVRGELLATDLLEWIVALPYSDPDAGTDIGPDAMEFPSNRTTFDDIDDFDGWYESPPQDVDGVDRGDLVGWARTVAVEWVTLGALDSPQVAETGVKKVTVTVTYLDKKIATIDRLRFQAASAMME